MNNICCIYLIKHKLDEEWENVYIGSTCNINDRIRRHKFNCYNERHLKYNYKVYQYIRENGGIDNFEFIILEECENDKLKRLEQSYMDVYKPTLNSQNAYGMKLTNHEHKTSYNIRNKEKRKEKFDCECGGRYSYSNKTQHFKSKKHQAFITKNKI